MKHLNWLEIEIKRSKKNFGAKFKAVYDKMYEEIKNYGLIPSVYNRHHFCTFELFEMESAIKEVIKTKTEKEQILKVIEDGKTKFELLKTED